MDQPNFHRYLTSYHWKPRTKAGPRPPSEPYRPLLTSNSPQMGRRKIDMMYKYKYKVQHLNITIIIIVKETSLPSYLSSWWWEQWSKREPSWEKGSNRMFVTRQAIISGSLSSENIKRKPAWYQWNYRAKREKDTTIEAKTACLSLFKPSLLELLRSSAVMVWRV